MVDHMTEECDAVLMSSIRTDSHVPQCEQGALKAGFGVGGGKGSRNGGDEAPCIDAATDLEDRVARDEGNDIGGHGGVAHATSQLCWFTLLAPFPIGKKIATEAGSVVEEVSQQAASVMPAAGLEERKAPQWAIATVFHSRRH